MSTELATPETKTLAIATPSNNPFLRRADGEGVVTGSFGRFNGKTGNYIVGDDIVTEAVDAVWAIADAKLGWIGFDNDNRPYRGPTVAMGGDEPLAEPTDIPDKKVRWTKQILVPVRFFGKDGSLNREQVLFTVRADKNSREGWKLMRRFGETYMRNLTADGRQKLPVITMDRRSFFMLLDEEKNGEKTGRKIKTELFSEIYDISQWITPEEMDDLMDGAPEDDAQQEETVVQHAEPEIIPPAAKVDLRRPASRFKS